MPHPIDWPRSMGGPSVNPDTHTVAELKARGVNLERVKRIRGLCDPGKTISLRMWSWHVSDGIHIRKGHPTESKQVFALGLCGGTISLSPRLSLDYYQFILDKSYSPLLSNLMEQDDICNKCIGLMIKSIVEDNQAYLDDAKDRAVRAEQNIFFDSEVYYE